MTGLIIIAAGKSARLGHPKQRVFYEGKTLLQRAVSAAVGTKCGPVIVVLGANNKELQADLSEEKVTIVENSDWEKGMSSSIHKGILSLQELALEIADVILMVCDQPFANTEILNKLIQKRKSTEKEIIACSYSNTLGVPALFDKKYFGELLSLSGQEGAKKLLKLHCEQVGSIDFPLGNIDIDTGADVEELKKLENQSRQ